MPDARLPPTQPGGLQRHIVSCDIPKCDREGGGGRLESWNWQMHGPAVWATLGLRREGPCQGGFLIAGCWVPILQPTQQETVHLDSLQLQVFFEEDSKSVDKHGPEEALGGLQQPTGRVLPSMPCTWGLRKDLFHLES